MRPPERLLHCPRLLQSGSGQFQAACCDPIHSAGRRSSLQKALEKQLEAAEARIADAEKEIQDLETRMADPELYQRPDEARETARRHAELQAGMDALYEEWEALSEAVSER